jgi:hypothetical protein
MALTWDQSHEGTTPALVGRKDLDVVAQVSTTRSSPSENSVGSATPAATGPLAGAGPMESVNDVRRRRAPQPGISPGEIARSNAGTSATAMFQTCSESTRW